MEEYIIKNCFEQNLITTLTVIYYLTFLSYFVDCFRIFMFFRRIYRFYKILIKSLIFIEKIPFDGITLCRSKLLFKNLKKIFKYINKKTIFSIIFLLLSEEIISFCEAGTNNIHHYLYTNDGDLVPVTNEEYDELMKKKQELEELKKRRQDAENAKAFIMIILTIIFHFLIGLWVVCGELYDNESLTDEEILEKEKQEYFKKNPPAEPYFTPWQHQKLLKNTPDTVKEATNPLFVGTLTGNYLMAEKHRRHLWGEMDVRTKNYFVCLDAWNKFFLEWEDDHFHHSRRWWRRPENQKYFHKKK
jgi:hypothetical protein